ncbi:MAG: YbjN domain-containing protein [Marinicaulis sp.]|nr:YbjN domain-containing protein [Marinicaulis sp.]
MMKMIGKSVAAIAAGVGMMFTVATAQTIDAVTADQLEAALEAAGLGPEMTEDAATGAPVATGTAGEFQFYVRALSCSGEPMACENLVFFANFELGRTATAKEYRIVNNFTESQVFGRAYVLANQTEVGVDYVIELGGGVTEDHLSQNISRWADIITVFVTKFQEGYSGS